MPTMPTSGMDGFADLVRLGFTKEKDYPCVFATGAEFSSTYFTS
jgi:hypothetical protein